MSIKNFFSIRRIFIIGILIRLIVMPFFAHDDFFAEHRRAERIVCEGVSPFSYSSFGVRIIESFFTRIFLPVIPCSNLAEIQKSDIDIFHLNRMLFLYKLPYLLFEIGFWIIIWNIFKKEDMPTKKRAAVFLALNPILIYSSYMFGRFEPYALLLSSSIIYILHKHQKRGIKIGIIILTSFIMAIILTIRFSYVFIIPALAFALGGLSIGGVLSIIGTLGFFLLFKSIPKIAGQQTILLPESDWIVNGDHPNYIFNSAIDAGSNRLYLFFILFAIFMAWWIYKEKVIQKLDWSLSFSIFSTIILFSYYATSAFHPQYLSWVIPFYLVVMVNDKSLFLWKMFWFSLIPYLMYLMSWGNAVTFGLAAPISIVFLNIEPKWFFPLLEFSKWANIGKSLFAGFSLYIIYFLFKYKRNEI